MNPLLMALLALLAISAAAPVAQAQGGVIEKIQSGLDEVVRGLDYVGKKAEDWIGPGLGLHEESAADFTQQRSFKERHPVGPAAMISLSNEFGRITVETWEDRLVEIGAEIVVGAESDHKAMEIAEAIAIQVRAEQDFIEITSLFADTRNAGGLVSIAVNYHLKIPRDAGLIADNFFGDIQVRDVGGIVALEAQYGAVELTNMRGPVKLRAHGEFPVKAHGLAQGGAFQLHGAEADFHGISGSFQVNAFRGSVHLAAIGQDALIDVVADSAPIRLDLQPQDSPDLSATAIYGQLDSDLPITHTIKSNRHTGRNANPKSRQRIMLNTAFANIAIRQEHPETAPQPQQGDQGKPFTDVVSKVEEAAESLRLSLDATIGDLRIQGIDENLVRIKATRMVWVASASDAPEALEALKLEVARSETEMRIDTVTSENMHALQCAAWRVNLTIECPRTTTLTIHAEEGYTSLEGLGARVHLSQNSGNISATHCKGRLHLINKRGDVTVEDCGDAVRVNLEAGGLLLKRIYGEVHAEVNQGRSIIEAPQAGVFVRNTGGDVRILALDGIGGPYDVLVKEGGLSMVMDPASSVALFVKSEGGLIHTGIPLDGRIHRTLREFQGRLNDGEHPVRLTTEGGDIYLD